MEDEDEQQQRLMRKRQMIVQLCYSRLRLSFRLVYLVVHLVYSVDPDCRLVLVPHHAFDHSLLDSAVSTRAGSEYVPGVVA